MLVFLVMKKLIELLNLHLIYQTSLLTNYSILTSTPPLHYIGHAILSHNAEAIVRPIVHP